MNTLKFNQIEFNHIGEQPSIPLQEKSVTITENGTTEVVPDSGFGLGKVKVKADVPSVKFRYFQVTPEFESLINNNTDALEIFSIYSYTARVESSGLIIVSPIPSNLTSISGIVAFCIEFNTLVTIYTSNGLTLGTIGSFLKTRTIGETNLYDLIMTLPEITYKEYYD